MKHIFNLDPKKSPVLSVILVMVLALTMTAASCNPTWLTTVTGYLNTFVPIAANIAQLILLFNPGGIPADLSVKLRGYLTEASNDATLLKKLVTDYNALQASDPAKPGKLKDINDLVATISSNLTQLLEQAHILNPSLQGKITEAVGVLLASIQDIGGLIPGVNLPTLSTTAQEATRTARLAAHGANRTAATTPVKFKDAADVKKAFNAIMTAPTPDAAVNSAAAGLVLK